MKHGKVWKKMKKDFNEYTEDPVPMKKKEVHAT